MHDIQRLLLCVARAAVRKGDQALEGPAPFGAVADIAAGIFQEYRDDSSGAALRGDLEALARADQAGIRQAAEETASREAAGRSDRVCRSLAAYLAQVPAAVRQLLRRPADPSGTTLPAALCPRVPQELVKFLPVRLPRFQPGDRPLGGWELVELLGQGSFGEVWKARHGTGDRQQLAALKFCLDPRAAHRLRSEPAVQDELERVRRQSTGAPLVPLLEVHPQANPPCLVYEYVEGSDLAGLIRERQAEGRLGPEQALQIMQELARALALAHRLDPPLVHGNLKVRNVLVRRGSDDGLSLQVGDFGCGGALFRRPFPEQVRGRPLRGRHRPFADRGSPLILPFYPEPVEGPGPRDDVYALGTIWYQLATGNPDLAALPPDWRDVAAECALPEKDVGLLELCLAARAENRLASASDLADRLAPEADPVPGDPEPTPFPGPWLSFRTDRQARTTPVCGVRVVDVRQARAARPEPEAGDLATVWVSQDLALRFAWVPPDTFLMGSLPGEAMRLEDEAPHRVTLTRGFYLGTHPVTQAQWRAVMGNNPSRVKAADHPVEMVSWTNCTEFCKRLRYRTGKHFRLPTEAEWEYACRAGTATAYHGGNGVDALRKVGWCSYDDVQGSAGGTQPVGQLAPNAWGLWDMHGNVWEWCRDWYGHYEGEGKDPIGPGFGSARVLRGGSWYYGPRFCRSARRVWKEPNTRYADIGFRILLCPE
jgi:formylglycine-generating enzyme required for sulfatase activity